MTRLVLFEAFVRSILCFGSAVWGVGLLDPYFRYGVDHTGALGVFYRSCLRSVMGVSRDLRSEILYVLTARLPLRLLLAKSVLQYVGTWTSHPRLVSRVVERATSVDSLPERGGLTCVEMAMLPMQTTWGFRGLYRSWTAHL